MLSPDDPPKLPPRCSACRRFAGPEEAKQWRWLKEGLGPLRGYCPSCAERELGLLPPDTSPESAQHSAQHFGP